MPATNDSVESPEEPMKCMEVWGGRCARNDCFRRPGLDIWIQSQDVEFADAGGGDLHLLSSCASGRITRMLLADICGIGPLFAEIAGELRDLMKQNVNAIQHERMVRDVSSRLEDASRKGGFASMLVSTYFAPSRSFSLCNTGHPQPFVFRKHNSDWSTLKHVPSDTGMRTSSAPNGVVDPGEYQQIKTKLDVGDMVLSYSNVLTECRGHDGNILGLRGVLERVRELDASRPEELGSTLIARLREEDSNNLVSGDATVLLCRASETKVALRDNVLAPFRLFGSVSDNTSID